jgi:hypothetical protein
MSDIQININNSEPKEQKRTKKAHSESKILLFISLITTHLSPLTSSCCNLFRHHDMMSTADALGGGPGVVKIVGFVEFENKERNI